MSVCACVCVVRGGGAKQGVLAAAAAAESATHISLNCHVTQPKEFCDRRASMSLFTHSACPSMAKYVNFFMGASPATPSNPEGHGVFAKAVTKLSTA